MSSSIGVVTQVVGEVSAVGSDGSRRLLVEGDRVFLGEQLICANDGAVAIDLDHGGDLTMGRASSLVLSSEWLAGEVAESPPGIKPSSGGKRRWRWRRRSFVRAAERDGWPAATGHRFRYRAADFRQPGSSWLGGAGSSNLGRGFAHASRAVVTAGAGGGQ